VNEDELIRWFSEKVRWRYVPKAERVKFEWSEDNPYENLMQLSPDPDYVIIPREAAERLLVILNRAKHKARAGRGRPARIKHERVRLLEKALQLKQKLRAEAKAKGRRLSADEAAEDAAKKVAEDCGLAAGTILDWIQHPGRIRGK
jgi:hypothetical protein